MALVLLQAVLIGQALYLGDPSRTTLHGWMGNATFVLAIILAGLSIISVRRGELSRPALGLSLLVALLVVAQIGLGYSGRRGGVPAALHIPNGVLIATLLAALLTVSFLPSSRADRLRP
jgi:heme A synthase